jgi:hypothetical protein
VSFSGHSEAQEHKQCESQQLRDSDFRQQNKAALEREILSVEESLETKLSQAIDTVCAIFQGKKKFCKLICYFLPHFSFRKSIN